MILRTRPISQRPDISRATAALLVVVLCATCGPTGAGESEGASASASSGTTSTTTIEATTTATGDAWPACTPRVLEGRGSWTVRDEYRVPPEGLDCMVTELNALSTGLTLDCLADGASTPFSIDLGLALPELSSLIGEPLLLLLATDPDVQINAQQSFVLRDANARPRLAGFRGYAPQQAEGKLLAPVSLVALDGICEPPTEDDWRNSWRGAVDATLATETVQIVDGDHAVLHGPDGDYHVLAPLVEHGTQGLDDTSPKVNVLIIGPSM